MSKTKSGLLLIAVGVGMYQIAQMLTSLSRMPHALSWIPVSLLIGPLGFFSLVMGLFGLFRLIVGLLSQKKQAKTNSEPPPGEGVWPPAPKMPHYEERENRE